MRLATWTRKESIAGAQLRNARPESHSKETRHSKATKRSPVFALSAFGRKRQSGFAVQAPNAVALPGPISNVSMQWFDGVFLDRRCKRRVVEIESTWGEDE